MNVTREVIIDLLPLYQEGEASPATRLLVEEFLAADPELRERLLTMQAAQPVAAATVRREGDQALRTMERTKAALARQKWLQFGALLLTLLPLTTVFQHGKVTFFLLRDAPLLLLPLWGGAAVFWYCYARSRRLDPSARS